MMGLSVEYAVRETATNLRRNLLMTLSAVLTVFVSLTLVAAALLLRQGVAKATLQWRGGVEVNIFLNVDASPTQAEAIENELAKIPEVKRYTFVDKEEAFEEFKTMFGNQPELVEGLSAQDLPASYRVVPREAEFAETIGERFEKREGVKQVNYAKDTVKVLLSVSRWLQVILFVIAAALVGSAVLLILNTIQMAIFARRREVAVMKLVGATNSFIRVPFMLEGMIQGLIGAMAAFGVVALLRRVMANAVGDNIFGNQLMPRSSDVIGTGIFVLVVGVIIGGLGSAVAVRRYLDV